MVVDMEKRSEPPIVLVKLWVELLVSEEGKEVKDHASNMLMGAFGSIEGITDYCNINNITLKNKG